MHVALRYVWCTYTQLLILAVYNYQKWSLVSGFCMSCMTPLWPLRKHQLSCWDKCYSLLLRLKKVEICVFFSNVHTYFIMEFSRNNHQTQAGLGSVFTMLTEVH